MTQREAIDQSTRQDGDSDSSRTGPADVSVEPLASGPETPSLSKRAQLAKAASQLWRASVGAAITLQHRTAKSFQHLAEKGARYQSQRKRRQQAMPDIESAEATQHSFREAASERMHHIEHSIENSLDRGRDNTLHWIGVPSRKDFDALRDQLETLTESVAALQRQLESERAAARPAKRAARSQA